MLQVKDRYDEVFDIEIEGWCYGIANFPGEILPGLIHRVIKELQPSFRAAIEHNVVFDILDISKRFSKAAKFLIHEKEVAFSIMLQLPNPLTMDEDRQFIVAQIVDKVEQAYGGALERIQKRWVADKRAAA